jgi:hypothetical protein
MTRDELLALCPDEFAPVPITLTGGKRAYVRPLDAVELARVRRHATETDEPGAFDLWCGLFALCAADGTALLTAADYPRFLMLGVRAWEIAHAATRACRIDGSDDAGKGSTPTPS